MTGFINSLGKLYSLVLPKGQAQRKQRVVSANTTAALDEVLVVVGNCTINNPAGTPIEGRGYWVWVINGTATIGGTPYAAPSYFFRRFHSGSWANTTPTSSTVTAPALQDVINLDANRALADRLVSDGATPNRGIAYTGGARQNIAGVPVVELLIEGRMPASSPINTSWWQSAPLGSSFGSDQFNSYRIGVQGTGFIFICANGASFNDRRIYTDNTQFISRVPAGQSYRLSVTHIAGTAAPIIILNGVNISSSFVASFGAGGSGTAPSWQDLGLSSTSQVSNYLWSASDCPTVVPILGSLSSTERDTWFTTGVLPPWVHAGGSAVNLIQNGDMSSATGYTFYSPQWSISGGVLTHTGTSNFGAVRQNSVVLTRGARYRVIFDLIALTAGNLLLQHGENTTVANYSTAAGAGTKVVEFIATETGILQFKNGTNGPLECTIDNWSAVQLGALTIPGPQGIGTVRDLTATGGNQGRLVGVTPILATPQPVSVVERPAESYTAATSVQLLGGAITGGRKRRLVSVSGNSSASVNLSLGTSSGGTQLVNAQAVNGDFDISTFASRILAANTSLWLTFSGNTTASIVIQITDL